MISVHAAITALASRVLPTPPGPVTVTSRVAPAAKRRQELRELDLPDRPSASSAASTTCVTRRPTPPHVPATRHRAHQRGTVGLVERQRVAQRAHGAWIGASALSALERTDRLGGHSGSFGELFLTQRRSLAELPEATAEVAPIAGTHVHRS